MSEKEKEIMEAIAEALPNMSDFEKGHLLGTAEQMKRYHEEQREKQDEVVVV